MFFADKVILIEGTDERLMLPEMGPTLRQGATAPIRTIRRRTVRWLRGTCGPAGCAGRRGLRR
ncbi:TOPRIM nucleotidyl transferase/hydrolase domain-containing protein [Streptomyces flaveolus]|uniref:TOPRIM nucleotidyl transferase/hydrolase domain-containing protein n=1 Tax=Streptomyces flaveolus TaxID=67297 RepID=UPI0036F6CF30